MTIARCVKLEGVLDEPVPPAMPVRPSSSSETWLMTVAFAGTVGRSFALNRRVRVYCGAMSSVHVMIVLEPDTTLPALAAAHPEGVIVHPVHGSSSPYVGAHTSSSAGTVSQTLTFHQVFLVEMFFMKISYVISSSGTP